jgi:hypothetical protein
MNSDAADRREWVRQRRLAEAREKAALRDNPPDPASAVERGLALIDFAKQVGSATSSTVPGVSDEDLIAYGRWAMVRNALRAA